MKTRTIIFAVFSIVTLFATAQTNDYSSYLNQAWSCVNSGNCDGAQRNYNVYKELTGMTNLKIEQVIDECKNGKNKVTENVNNMKPSSVAKGYIDLGLPSGTLWKESNEDDNNFYTWQQAKNKYNNSLPSHKQMEELRSHCRFVNIGNNVKVIGPNGKYITLQNTGYRRSDGTITNTNYCCCWSSSSETNSNKAWSLSILGKGIVVIGVADKDDARPIRLIRSK